MQDFDKPRKLDAGYLRCFGTVIRLFTTYIERRQFQTCPVHTIRIYVHSVQIAEQSLFNRNIREGRKRRTKKEEERKSNVKSSKSSLR